MANPKKGRTKKKTRQVDANGVVHIKATFNNTIITIADTAGRVISWASAGKVGFKGSKKSTPFAAQLCLDRASRAEALAQENAPAHPLRARLAGRVRALQQPFMVMQASLGCAVAMANRTRMALYPPDLLLDVRLPGVTVFSTRKNEEAIDAGYRVAHEHRAALRALARPLPPPWRRRLSSSWSRAQLAWRVYKDPGSLLEG